MYIGPYELKNPLILAPMAGVTDKPFRLLCRRYGAALAVSEMVSANSSLWGTNKTLRRLDFEGEPEPVSVQILGADPVTMAEAARVNVGQGAHIIDINMGCPAKKVCKVAAGSALLRDEVQVGRILEAVVAAVEVPVTLKIRTGWDRESRNAVAIARLAEACGIAALTVHGRTRACGFSGEAEHDTLCAVRDVVSLPLIANGDIDSPQKAAQVLANTGADAVMIGRAARGRPWLFRQIQHYLAHGELLAEPAPHEIGRQMLAHLEALVAFYGEEIAVRIARKHLAWYSRGLVQGADFRRAVNDSGSLDQQVALIRQFFLSLQESMELAA